MIRSLLAALSGLLAAALLPVGILSVWVDAVVSDTDTYVDTVTPLADDDVVKAAAVDELERQALALVGSSGTALPPGSHRLVHLAVQRVVDDPAFRVAWSRANRSAHEQLVAVLEDRSDARLDDRGQVTIDLGTALATIARDLAAQGLVGAGQAAGIHASFAVMDADQLAKARRLYDALDALGFWLPVAWALMVLLTLLLSHRRLATTAKLAAASLVMLGVLALALVVARDVLTQELSEKEVARAVWDVVLASLWRAIEVTAVVLAVLTVAAGLLGRRRSRPGQDATVQLE